MGATSHTPDSNSLLQMNGNEAELFWCEPVQPGGAIPQVEEGAVAPCACVGCGCAGCGAVPDDDEQEFA